MALLSQYLTVLRNLIQSPTSPVPLLPDSLLTLYINLARGQVSAMGECVPGYGVLEVGPDDQQYPFAAIAFPGDNPTNAGVAGALAIRLLLRQIGGAGTGQKRLFARDWPWFAQYELGQPVPKRGEPRVWSQYGQGASGSIFINALDSDYRLTVDARCHPVDLVDDNTPDAIPYLWSDAVPFLAAWYSYMALQRQADAEQMNTRFQQMMQTARGGATPAVQPGSFVGGPDLFLPGRLGMQPAGRAHPRQQTPPTAA